MTPLLVRSDHCDQSGQILPLVAVLIPILILLVGASVDLGMAYYMRGKLQSSADAAALAGAQALPDEVRAAALAQDYSAGAGNRNQPAGVTGVSVSATFSCTDPRFCGNGARNAITVDQTASMSTFFLRLVGIDTVPVEATGTACSPCGSKPTDVMLVLDRSGSMCTDNYTGVRNCVDMQNAKDGMRDFLNVMDPGYDHVGFAVFPPIGTPCRGGSGVSGYDPPDYIAVPLSSDYKTAGALNTSSQLVSTINCQDGNGGTSYAHALEAAQGELDRSGRPNAQDIIIFLSDGAARNAPSWAPQPYKDQPCAQGIRSAAAIKARGTIIYSIGYDVDATGAGAEKCMVANTNTPESPTILPITALQGIASPGNYYNKPNPGDLSAIFLAIAKDMAQGTSRLTDTPAA
jgi:hypothetical protein